MKRSEFQESLKRKQKKIKELEDKRKEISIFVEDHLPVIHKSGRLGAIVPVFTSKKAQYEAINMLTDGIYGSSVGFRGDALVELETLSKSRDNDPENKLDFKTANFENNIYSVTKC